MLEQLHCAKHNKNWVLEDCKNYFELKSQNLSFLKADNMRLPDKPLLRE